MSEPIVTFDEKAIKNELRELVRQTVEDTLNGLLEEEADDLVGAGRYERTADREAYRAGHYDRKLVTTSGEVTVRMPKLKGMRFTTAIIERYRRRETSVEEAMIEMYLAGVSTRRIEDVSEALWGASVSAATVSNLNEKAFESVERWRSRPLTRAYPYVYVDGIYLKRAWGGAYENVAVMVAIGVNDDGYREVIGAAEGFTESADCWRDFLSWLKGRGLRGVRMSTGRLGRRHGRRARGGVPEGGLPTLHGSFLPQRVLQGPEVEAQARGGQAQGDTRPGVLRGQRGEGAPRRRRFGGVAAEGGRQGRARGVRRDADVHALPDGALEADPHQQRHRAAQPRDQEANARRRHVPGRQERPHAGHRQAQVRSRQRMGV